MRKHGKTDANQALIVRTLRHMGMSVQSLADIGNGCPDILVGVAGNNILLEIKDGDKRLSERKLTPDEKTWQDNWRGQVHTVEDVEQAIKICCNCTKQQ